MEVCESLPVVLLWRHLNPIPRGQSKAKCRAQCQNECGGCNSDKDPRMMSTRHFGGDIVCHEPTRTSERVILGYVFERLLREHCQWHNLNIQYTEVRVLI